MEEPTDRTLALRMRGVRYAYAGTSLPALDGIDLEISLGEVVGIVGPTDAGKSTLCLVAAGLAPAAIGGRLVGDVELNGVLTRDLPPHQAAQRAGILFQNAQTQLSSTAATVYEEVALGPRNLGLHLGEVVERTDRALAALGIESLGPRNPTRLSGGQAQLVALASVIALRPALLVLDEPTSQLDPAGSRLVVDALARLALDRAAGILVVEHRTELLADLATSVLLVDRGHVIHSGPVDQVLADRSLPEHGVDPPPWVRLERLAAERGMHLAPEMLAR